MYNFTLICSSFIPFLLRTTLIRLHFVTNPLTLKTFFSYNILVHIVVQHNMYLLA